MSEKIHAFPMAIAGNDVRRCVFCGKQMEIIIVEWSQMGGSESLYKCDDPNCNRAGNKGEK